MRIPLDYYRILSVPVKANAAQLEQAYQDRLLQQPRREYSGEAVAARQQLIEKSYQVLSTPKEREEYDAQFLLNMQPLETSALVEESESSEGGEEGEAAGVVTESEMDPVPLASPTIEIDYQEIVGALLILHELGEYETVLRLGIDDFNGRERKQRSPLELEISLDPTQEDLILVLTLAYMELGREQWHRQEYENAAISTQLGIDLLQQQSLFPHLQLELEQDLAKLRPYRVLELISQNPAKSAAREEGFELLQSMLIQRQGIEGKGEDRSGLNFDQFLCFVQQLRTFLTSAEQQELFDNESQSKSAIAHYLAVYALLGRGFCLKQPELILRAQRKLDFLSEKQDVSWEQAIAALLLGHIEKAIQKLKDAPDQTYLQQVQQHVLGSSDLLPGLCFYGELWLVEDVIAQFSDLANAELTLKEYFADYQVQSYLEELSVPTGISEKDESEPSLQPTAKKSQAEADIANFKIMSLWRNIFSPKKADNSANQSFSSAHGEILETVDNSNHYSSSTATLERQGAFSQMNSKAYTPRHQTSFPPETPPQSQDQSPSKKSLSLPLESGNHRAVPESVIRKAQAKARSKKIVSKGKRKAGTLWKGWLFIISLIFGIGTISYLGTKLVLAPPNKTAKDAQLAIAVNQPSVKIPAPKTKVSVAKPQPKPTLTQQSRQVIQDWLDSKAAAFGKEHQIERLNLVLTEPLLTTWRDRAKTYQQQNIYRDYEHAIVMRSAKLDPQDPNKATVEAEVKETAKHYQSGQLDQTQSYDDNLLLRYQLVRQGEKWLIQQAEVLKNL